MLCDSCHRFRFLSGLFLDTMRAVSNALTAVLLALVLVAPGVVAFGCAPVSGSSQQHDCCPAIGEYQGAKVQAAKPCCVISPAKQAPRTEACVTAPAAPSAPAQAAGLEVPVVVTRAPEPPVSIAADLGPPLALLCTFLI